ncbi:Probable fatty acid synthase Fas [Mycobacteroides abscessus]|nr:Probable fatty acid synthase Fas [Mycobacteroides abscessus]
MTINEYDKVTSSEDPDANGAVDPGPSAGPALIDRLESGEPYAVAFGGQGSDWLESLADLAASAGIESELATLAGEAELRLEPVAKELVVVRPVGFSPLTWVRALTAEEPVPAAAQLTSAAVSMPGVLLAQLAAVRALKIQGLDLAQLPPVAVIGHSQGVLAVEALKAHGARDVELLAIAQLVGAAATLVARRRGIVVRGNRTPMVSVTNVDPERMKALLDEFAQDVRTVQPPALSIRNGRRSVVITGTPEQLSRFELYCEQIAEREAAERKDKVRGGAVFSPVFDPVDVEVGFHTPRLADGVEIAGRWAAAAGLDVELTKSLTEAILVTPVDWVNEVNHVADAGARWILDLGPGDLLTRLTAPVIRGLGIGIVPTATRGGQRNLFMHGAVPEVARAWTSFAPTVVSLPDGSVKLSTKFPRLTGRSPILLAGMTPTTVDAKIVAAAANAGHWSELAGGGQVTEEIFSKRIEELTGLLEPGRQIQFNSLFLDPYLWKLQVGSCGCGECGPLVRARRWWTGHRGDLQQAHRGTDRAAGAGSSDPIQLAVPRPLPVEAAGGFEAPGAEGPSGRGTDRRCRRHRRYPGAGRGRRAYRRAHRNRVQPHRVQARHCGADPLGGAYRGRGSDPADHHARRGWSRGWSPLMGRPRRPVADHLLGAAFALQHHRVCGWGHRHARAGCRIPQWPLGTEIRLPADAGRRHSGRHRGHGHLGGHHVAVGQADAGADPGHPGMGACRKGAGRHGLRA